MRINEVLSPSKEGYKQVLALIAKDCQPYLSQNQFWRRKPLFRGLGEAEQFVIHGSMPKNRKPASSPNYIHEAAIEAFDMAGFKANRHNSIFCSGSFEQANEYADYDPYYVFPKGEFSFCWSRQIPDFYLMDSLYYLVAAEVITAPNLNQELTNFLEGNTQIYLNIPNKEEKIRHILSMSNSPKKQLEAALHMLDQSFYVHHIIKFEIDKQKFEEFVTRNYQDTDLKAAISSMNEITINAPAGVLYVRSSDDFMEFLEGSGG